MERFQNNTSPPPEPLAQPVQKQQEIQYDYGHGAPVGIKLRTLIRLKLLCNLQGHQHSFGPFHLSEPQPVWWLLELTASSARANGAWQDCGTFDAGA